MQDLPTPSAPAITMRTRRGWRVGEWDKYTSHFQSNGQVLTLDSKEMVSNDFTVIWQLNIQSPWPLGLQWAMWRTCDNAGEIDTIHRENWRRFGDANELNTMVKVGEFMWCQYDRLFDHMMQIFGDKDLLFVLGLLTLTPSRVAPPAPEGGAGALILSCII